MELLVAKLSNLQAFSNIIQMQGPFRKTSRLSGT